MCEWGKLGFYRALVRDVAVPLQLDAKAVLLPAIATWRQHPLVSRPSLRHLLRVLGGINKKRMAEQRGGGSSHHRTGSTPTGNSNRRSRANSLGSSGWGRYGHARTRAHPPSLPPFLARCIVGLIPLSLPAALLPLVGVQRWRAPGLG